MSTQRPKDLLRVSGLRKHFGNQEILKGIDLVVNPGDRIAILGVSGSGKSTLLRCLNFMETPTQGQIQLSGQVIGSERTLSDGSIQTTYSERELIRVRQRVGMVFQQFNLFPHMTALGNVMEGLRTVKGMAHDAAQTKALEQLARVGLLEKANDYPARLSGGQKQRVAIARSLINDPLIIMGDEPTGNLDKKNSNIVFDVFKELTHTMNQTLLIVTHDQEFANNTDRIIDMEDGRIISS
jgi:polar amino acid transport system ATP-binding protein